VSSGWLYLRRSAFICGANQGAAVSAFIRVDPRRRFSPGREPVSGGTQVELIASD
jgi:hypothetical protein